MLMIVHAHLINQFQATVWSYYRANRRAMPWREQPTPYYVLVSEIMLQQTQLERVKPKFVAFVDTFPTIRALAAAPWPAVMQQWSGLGYNRRARFLQQTAKVLVQDYDATLPAERQQLEALPGIGPNTAGAIMAYAFNQPVVFVETNIRSVFLHHFFHDQDRIADAEIVSLVDQTLPRHNPREWYWALMDYGTSLKAARLGRISRSKHYKKQSTFAGSLRQMRGLIVKRLMGGPLTENELSRQLLRDERIELALEGLIRDGLIERQGLAVGLTGDGRGGDNR